MTNCAGGEANSTGWAWPPPGTKASAFHLDVRQESADVEGQLGSRLVDRVGNEGCPTGEGSLETLAGEYRSVDGDVSVHPLLLVPVR